MGVPIFSKTLPAAIHRDADGLTAETRERPNFGHIIESLKRVDFNTAEARRYVAAAYTGDTMRAKRDSRLFALDLIDAGYLFAFSCSQGRLYHNYVQLAKDCRRFATIDGQPLIQIDYSALQPSLLGTLYPERSAEWFKFAAACESGLYEYFAKFFPEFDLTNVDQRKS